MSSRGKKVKETKVQPEKISGKASGEASRQPGFISEQGGQYPGTKGVGPEYGAGVPSMAEAVEVEEPKFGRSSRSYQGKPSVAEVAEQPRHGSIHGAVPSIAEMAEPLVGGGEPVPSAVPSEGTASRSLAEQADIDRELAEQGKHRAEVESEKKAPREGGQGEAGGGWKESSKTQHEPGVSVPLALGEKPMVQEGFVPDEQAQSKPQAYQRFEKSGEPVRPADVSEEERRAKGAYQKQQQPLGHLPSEAFQRQERFTPDEQAQSKPQAYQRFEKSGEPVGISQEEQREKQTGAYQQQQQQSLGQLSPEASQRRQGQPSQPSVIGQGFSVGPIEQQSVGEKGKQIPIAGEAEQQPEQKGSFVSERTSAESGPSYAGHQPESGQFYGGRKAESAPKQGQQKTADISQRHPPTPSAGEQAQVFYAQGEGYRGRFESQQGKEETLPEEGQQQQRGGFFQPGSSEKQSPSQASAELRSTTGEGGRLGREELSSVPSSVRGEAGSQSRLGGITTEFAKMQVPSAQFAVPREMGKESKSTQQQPGATQDTDLVGVGAESGRPVEYEYLPHPADIQFHSWGSTKVKTFENMADCMFNYMGNLEKVEADPQFDFPVEVLGEDDKELLYKFLDELLFRFNSRKQIICKRVDIEHIDRELDGSYRLKATGHGEPFNASKHGSGTEIKAITLASLQVNEKPGRTEAFVIVDI